MLVLTRRESEAINIGDNIKVIVTRIKDNQVRIGIKAPADMLILREELCGNQAKQRKT